MDDFYRNFLNKHAFKDLFYPPPVLKEKKVEGHTKLIDVAKKSAPNLVWPKGCIADM